MGSSPIRVAKLKLNTAARTEEVVNDSPVDCQSRRRPRRAVRAATKPHPSRQVKINNTCGFSSFGRAPPCQGGGGGFEPRNPLQNKKQTLVVCFLFWNPTLRSCAVPKRREALSLPCKLNVLFRTKAKQRSVIRSFINSSRHITYPKWYGFSFGTQPCGAAQYQNGAKP